MIGRFVLVVKVFTVIGDHINFMNYFDVIAIIFYFGLDWDHEVVGIFLYKCEDGEHSIKFRTLRMYLRYISEDPPQRDL